MRGGTAGRPALSKKWHMGALAGALEATPVPEPRSAGGEFARREGIVDHVSMKLSRPLTTPVMDGMIVRSWGSSVVMRTIGKATGFLAVALVLTAAIFAGAAWFNVAPAQQPDFHAIVERDGTVVLCITKGEILFADRCVGSGRLTIVQPMEEGPVVWRSVVGTVVMENESPQNPDCALSRAKWDPRIERAVSSGKNIKKVEPATVLSRLDKRYYPEVKNLMEADVTAFAVDLDNDGNDEIVFGADNVRRLADLHEKTQKTYPYVVRGGILSREARFDDPFFFEAGEYSGGTDTIGGVDFKGIVPIAAGTGEIALLVRTGNGFNGEQILVRFRRHRVQRIETIEFSCN